MIKAVIFDCFGVLATDGWIPFRRQHFADDKSLQDKAEQLNRKMNIGQITYQTFVNEVSAMAGVSPEILDKQIDSNVPNEDLLNFIKNQLKPKLNIGVLSNSGANWLDIIFSKSQMSLFDAVVLSYEIGTAKPDAAAYQAIAQRLNTPIKDCLFIDDQERYCEAAREAGMKSVKYDNPEQIMKAIKNYL